MDLYPVPILRKRWGTSRPKNHCGMSSSRSTRGVKLGNRCRILSMLNFSETESHDYRNLVAPACVSLRTTTSMCSILPWLTTTQKLAIRAATNPAYYHTGRHRWIYVRDSCDSEYSESYNVCRFFNFFNFLLLQRWTFSLLPFFHLTSIGPRLIARYTWSDALEPQYTSTYVLLPPTIAVAKSRFPEKKAWPNPATPQPRTFCWQLPSELRTSCRFWWYAES